MPDFRSTPRWPQPAGPPACTGLPQDECLLGVIHLLRIGAIGFDMVSPDRITDWQAEAAYRKARRPLTRQERLRRQVMEHWGGRCAYCDKEAQVVSPVIPRNQGGAYALGNLLPACVHCNGGKGARSLDVFLKNNPKRLAQAKEYLHGIAETSSAEGVA